jgi:hypothetical protein
MMRPDPYRRFADTPPVHLHRLPRGIGAGGPGLQAALAFPFGRFGPALALGLRFWGVMQGGIPTQARDHDHLVFDTRQRQGDRRETAIDDQHQLAPRQPAAHSLDHLGTQSMLVLCWRRSAFSAGQHRAVRKGNAHTRRFQGTGTRSIIATHFRPKQRMTCFLVERTASR